MACEYNQFYYYDLITGNDVPPEVKKHVETCDFCTEQIHALRTQLDLEILNESDSADLLAIQFQLVDRWISCTLCKPFLPLFLIPSLQIRVQSPIREHLEACEFCRADLESLEALSLQPEQLLEAAAFLTDKSTERGSLTEQTVSVLEQIKLRDDAPVLTKTSFDPKAREDENGIRTVVQNLPVPTVSHASSRILPVWISRFTAAAVLILGVFLYFQTTEARGLSLEHIFLALERNHTVSIQVTRPMMQSDTVPDRLNLDLPADQYCLSKQLGIYYYKTGKQHVLVDMNKHLVLRNENGTITREFTNQEYADTTMKLLPFDSPDQIPNEYEWEKSSAPDLPVIEGTTVYDLTWQDGPVKKLWRGYLNREGLPVRIEFWDKNRNESFKPVTILDVSYPTLDQLRRLIREAGFHYLEDQINGL